MEITSAPTNKEIISLLQNIKQSVINKESRLFFFVADTNGVPMASIEQIYKIAKQMERDGYIVIMLHEKEKFIGVEGWMGKEYSSLRHVPLSTMNENPEFKINGADFFIVPELYSDLIKKLKESKLPSETVVICQSHTFVFKYLNAGENWSYFGVENVITTSNKMKMFLEEYQPVKNIHVINPVITKEFSPSNLPQKPIISIISRNPDDIERIAKLFYQKYPMYSWVSFKTLGNMKKVDFANALKETCLAIWLDDYATFGTFPLECMASGVPVMIKIPDLIPEWAEKIEGERISLADNAVYVSNILAMPDYIAKFMEAWLLGDVPETLYENMKKTPSIYTEGNFKEQVTRAFNKIFENKINKLQATIEKYESDDNNNPNT